MSKKTRKIKSTFIFSLLIFSFFITMIYPTSKASFYNANIILDVDWDLEETEKPIIPRDEIKEINFAIKFRIVTDTHFGKGLFLGYAGSERTHINLHVVESPPWCSAVLERNLVTTNISEYDETTSKLYLIVDETAPAYGVEGVIKIKARSGDLGLIKGFEKVFTLFFDPAYIPIIKTNLPDVNTKQINPTKTAVFPIEIENAGNARTDVLFEIENIPEGWEASISEEVFLNEAKGSKDTAYLTVIPPSQFGYHYEAANIRVTMTPVRTENPNEVGNPLYATFTVYSRGLSTNGIEQIFYIIMLIIIVLVMVIFILRRIRKRQDKSSS